MATTQRNRPRPCVKTKVNNKADDTDRLKQENKLHRALVSVNEVEHQDSGTAGKPMEAIIHRIRFIIEIIVDQKVAIMINSTATDENKKTGILITNPALHAITVPRKKGNKPLAAAPKRINVNQLTIERLIATLMYRSSVSYLIDRDLIIESNGLPLCANLYYGIYYSIL